MIRVCFRVFVAALAVATLLLRSPVSFAQPAPAPQALEQAKARFAKGKELYDKGDKAAAVEEFKEAYKLSRNPLLLYNVGLVYDDLKDPRLALYYYEKFLSDAPADDRTKSNRENAQRRVKALTDEVAKLDAQATPTPTPPEVTPAPPTTQPAAGGLTGGRVAEFTHTPLEVVPPGKPVDVTVRIPEDAKWTVTLFYRPAGQEAFKAVKMHPRYTEVVGRIPAGDVRGANFNYYVVAQDAAGRDVGGSGKAGSPNIVYVEEGAKAHFYQDLEGSLDGETMGGGPVDTRPAPSRTRRILRWSATGTAVALLGASLVLFLKAQSSSSTLEDEATTFCGGEDPPCVTFSDYQKGVEDNGKSYETWTNVTLFSGLAVAAAAGTLWYLDLRSPRRPEATASTPSDDTTRLVTVPVVGEDFVGGAAVVQF